MKITKKFLKDRNACKSSYNYVCENNYIGLDKTDFLKKLIKENRLSDAEWLIVRVMGYTQYVSYAIFAAEQVIDIFEKQYPDDKRPRQAIEAAKKCIENSSEGNKSAAAYAAAYAANAAAYAAADAVKAAYDAVNAAYAAYAADANAASAARAASAAEMKKKILNYGISLLEV